MILTSLEADTFKDFKKTPIKSFVKSDFFFRQTWNTYEMQDVKKLYLSKKPTKILSLAQTLIKDVGPKIRIIPPKPNEYEQLQLAADEDVKIDFFSTKIGFDIPKEIKTAKFYPQSQKGIENFFSVALSSEYDFLIRRIKQISTDMRLNDWGIYLLVEKLSKKIYTERDNGKLFLWFVFNQLGYDVKASVIKKHVSLLFATKQVVFDVPNYIINDKTYYILDSSSQKDSAYTYDTNYPDANKTFDFSLHELPFLAKKISQKDLIFVQDDTEYKIAYEYNKNLIEFMKTYPNVQSSVFFEAPLDSISELSIAKNFKKYLDGKRASSGINLVLSFTQKAFKYQNDNEQFQRQKSMFAQETLFYKNSDSEDRVALFINLIKHLFGFNSIGVKYKDHMSAALYVPIKGDSVKDGRKRYVIADPTYPNANLGENIFKYSNQKAKELIILR